MTPGQRKRVDPEAEEGSALDLQRLLHYSQEYKRRRMGRMAGTH